MIVPCKSCRAPMIWARTENGKNVPLDAEPTPAGNIHLRADGVAVYVKKDQMDNPLFPPERRYKSHYATCPHAPEHRRKAPPKGQS